MFLQIYLYPYTWNPIGDSTLKINDGYIDPVDYRLILCADEGILFGDLFAPEFVKSMLPVVAAVTLDKSNVLVLMADGSYSDGIYKYNHAGAKDDSFELVNFLPNPNFILYCSADEKYYVGHDSGMYYSTDGVEWLEIVYFNGKNCQSMTFYETKLAVIADNHVHYLDLNGNCIWQESESEWQPVDKLMFTGDSKLYGIFPGYSESAGLRSSADFGKTWQAELWESISALGQDFAGNIFIGSREYEIGMTGAALWFPEEYYYSSLNDGLPNKNINNIFKFNGIDCAAVIYCTDLGAYYVSDYDDMLGIAEESELVKCFELYQNYPNPFNPTTSIRFSLPKATSVKLKIFNSSGFEIAVTVNKNRSAGYHSIDFDGSEFTSGIYFYSLEAGGRQIGMKKMIMIK